jgi:hypothetical protein
MKSIRCIMVLVLALAVPIVSQAQESKLSDREKQLIYSRGFEAILWGSPMLATYSQAQANRDLGAGNTDVVYTGEKPDYRWGGVTYNVQSPYWVSTFNVKDGPIVVDLPPAGEKARFFSSIMNYGMSPFLDIGSGGADNGKGGKYLVLPPGYDGEVPEGYIVVRSNTYQHIICMRLIPRDKGRKGWEAAVVFGKTARIYPLSEADNPKPTRFIQGSQKTYDAAPRFDISDFYMLDRIVQEEPIMEYDKVMYSMLAGIGIRKGQKFAPSPEVVTILERAAKDVQDYVIAHMQSGESFAQFWEDSAWGSFSLTPEENKTFGTYNLDDGLFYEDRIIRWFYFSGGWYKNFDAAKPSATYYMWTAQDGDGNGLDATKTYKIHIPANPPIKDFWSLIAYGLKSRTFINSPKITMSSNDEDVKMNKDGSIDLYLSAKPVKGYEANTVIMNPEEPAFLCFRFYGAKPELWEKKWILGDPELVKQSETK